MPLMLAVQASIAANTYVISGPSQTKSKSGFAMGQICSFHNLDVVGQDMLCMHPLTLTLHAVVCAHATAYAEIQEMLPNILNQMGPDSLQHLKKIMQQVGTASSIKQQCRHSH